MPIVNGRFNPIIKRARVGTPGFSADAMQRFGNLLNNSIIARLDRAQDVNDNSVAPLKETYRLRKEKKGERGTSVRDLYYTGRTRRSMKLLRASQNLAVIGFSDPVAAQRMIINNRKYRQYGVSPTDLQALYKAISADLEKPVAVVKIA